MKILLIFTMNILVMGIGTFFEQFKYLSKTDVLSIELNNVCMSNGEIIQSIYPLMKTDTHQRVKIKLFLTIFLIRLMYILFFLCVVYLSYKFMSKIQTYYGVSVDFTNLKSVINVFLLIILVLSSIYYNFWIHLGVEFLIVYIYYFFWLYFEKKKKTFSWREYYERQN